MIQGVFITGTDTGVGKTVVAAGVLACGRARGMDLVPMKPVETGVEEGEVEGTDLGTCLTAAGMRAGAGEVEMMGPYRYGPASSPHLAGRLAGRYPEVGRIVTCAEALSARHAGIVVEGAGGVMVPLDERLLMLDLMQAMGLPVVLVARRGLGTINHTLLSLGALRGAGVRVLGVALNETRAGERDFVDEDNPKAIEAFGGTRVLGRIGYQGELDARDWGWFEREMPGLEEVLREATGS